MTAYQWKRWEQNYCFPIWNARCNFCSKHCYKKSPSAHFLNSSSISASQEISSAWFFKRTSGCSALWLKTKEKRNGTEKSLLALGFNSDISGSQFNWTTLFLHWLGEKKHSSLKAPSIFTEFVQIQKRNQHFYSNIVLPLDLKNKKTKTKKQKLAMFLKVSITKVFHSLEQRNWCTSFSVACMSSYSANLQASSSFSHWKAWCSSESLISALQSFISASQ